MGKEVNPEKQIAAIIRNINTLISESKEKIFVMSPTYLRNCIKILSNLGVDTSEINEEFTTYTNNRQSDCGAFTTAEEIRYTEDIARMILEKVCILREELNNERVA